VRPPPYPFRSEAARSEYLAFYDARAARWPVPSRTRTVSTRFGETFVRESGPPDGPPLVLLPGMSSSSLMWETLIAPLAERHRAIAVDSVFDVGRSTPARDAGSAEDLALWVDELLAGLALEHVDLVGMSYGAFVAAHVALRHPERLRRSVWLAPAGVAARLSWLWVSGALASGFSRSIHRSFTEWMFADAVKSAEGRRIVEELIDDTQVMIRCCERRPIVTPATLSDRELASIRVPTLMLVGEHETVCSAREAVDRVQATAPSVRAELVPDAGHDLPIAQRDEVLRRVLAFLDEG
jgi:pimeloyl-ACP methyl ester carboxylesterase